MARSALVTFHLDHVHRVSLDMQSGMWMVVGACYMQNSSRTCNAVFRRGLEHLCSISALQLFGDGSFVKTNSLFLCNLHKHVYLSRDVTTQH